MAQTRTQLLKNLADKRVLLVGGAGFIGHNLALTLRRHGATVMVADNLMHNNLVSNVTRAIRSKHCGAVSTRIFWSTASSSCAMPASNCGTPMPGFSGSVTGL